MIRLTDKELNWLGQRGTGGDLRDYDEDDVLTTMDMLPLAVAELRERRAQDLTGEGQAALEWLNDEVRYMIEDGEKDDRWRKSAARALSALSKLLTRGNR